MAAPTGRVAARADRVAARAGREAGFTLIEMMVTVVVIAVLAAIALPSFFSEARKSKAMAEVQPLFNDIRVRLEQHQQENGSYPSPSPGEGSLWPPAPSATRQALLPLPASWDPLKLRLSGEDQVYCSYTWVTYNPPPGPPPPPPPPPIGPQATIFAFTAPGIGFYYLLAKCDMDGDPSQFSWYFTSSVNPAIRRLNEGS